MQKHVTRATVLSSSIYVCNQFGGAMGESYGNMVNQRYIPASVGVLITERAYETIGSHFGSAIGVLIAVGGIALVNYRNSATDRS